MYYIYQNYSYICPAKQKKMEQKDKKRGGARAGAGRPKGDSRMISFRATGRLADELDRMENRTEFIRKTLSGALFNKSLTLPYFDIRVVAGFPVPLDNDERSQDIDIISMLCPHPEASYLIRVSGDSMKDAGVFSGDIVIVDKSNRNPSPRDVAMCVLNGEYTLKHFVKEEGQGWLVPANPDYPRIKITPEDEFSIWGTVTYIIHRPRE